MTYEKMSKSKHNGVIPEGITQKYGVDSLRMALMFGAPPDVDFNFDEKKVKDMKSYLDRVSRLGDLVSHYGDFKGSKDKLNFDIDNMVKYRDGMEHLTKVQKLIGDYHKKIGRDRSFHVAIARLMEATNHLSMIDL